MNADGVSVSGPQNAGVQEGSAREDLVRRVASGVAFEKSLRLRAFLLHVCRCALDNRPEAATEQQIGIRVYDRPPGYNPNEDNIVRSQARLLRMKLEHHFATEGKDEAIVITVPKGRYLPVFQPRFEEPAVPPGGAALGESPPRRVRRTFVAAAALCGVGITWLGYRSFESRPPAPQTSAIPEGSLPRAARDEEGPSSGSRLAGLGPGASEIRIAAGRVGSPYVDVRGRRWETDHYYEGGVSRPGPRRLFPPVADPGLFRTMREAVSTDPLVPQWFRYDIPASSGVYELRLYFADPLRQPDAANKEDAQNTRHFQVKLNGRLLLAGFDPVAGAGFAAVDVRVFKDVTPAADGKVHLEFLTGGERPFVSALELTPGAPGKLKPIRIRAHPFDLVDADGVRWSGDDYFIAGRTALYGNPETGPKVPAPYTGERHGNFSYAIPVAPGSYTVKLHFLESFFSPLIPAAYCQGVGCRVFDVACNGVMLLQDFDITQAAAGAFRPVVREFHGLRPNGQGKLLLSFSPRVNYAEIRAIEVIDEAK